MTPSTGPPPSASTFTRMSPNHVTMKPLLADDADADDVSRRRLSKLDGVKLTPLMPTLSLISSPPRRAERSRSQPRDLAAIRSSRRENPSSCA